MSITDELRKSGVCRIATDRNYFTEEELTAIADRIDAEHEKAMNRAGQLLADAESDRDHNYANWQDCKQKVLQHNITIDELDAKIECLEDELSHCIKLPVDADGEVIHEGDAMDTEHFGTVEVEGFIHNSIAFYNYREQPAYLCTTPANMCRHHHEPTVENVLLEFARECLTYATCVDDHEVQDAIEMYAAKLRLVGDGE
jgi:hypothetical protein